MSASPAMADELSDVKAQLQTLTKKLNALEAKQDAQQQQMEAKPVAAAASTDSVLDALKGSFPRSFRIPGTDTSLRIGGYVKLDAIYDADAPQGDEISPTTIPLAGTPAARRQGSFRLDARQSRFDIETRTPTEYGQLKTYIEGDFYGSGGNEFSSNSTTFRIRHAYGELGPVLAGQYWSNFIDPESYAETLDFNGPAGQVFVRQGQIRFTQPVGSDTTLSVAIENPEGDFFASPNAASNSASVNAGAGGTTGNNLDALPDFTARLTTKNSWGQFTFSALAREIQANVASGPLTGRNGRDFGYGLSAQGVINTHLGKDKFFYEINGGTGLGRYLQDGVGTAANFDATTGRLGSETAFGAYGAYQHWWLDNLRSSFIYGHDELYSDIKITGPSANRSIDTVHTNLIWSPVPNTNLGIEYIYGRRETVANARGELNRMQVSAQFNF
ncbi:MAG TPA: DcaP family trimeric outer membrane transporter [Aliidongia sp.]|nr:DcaP family trimeric outer membrane transporter [Aliidongia sp.]